MKSLLLLITLFSVSVIADEYGCLYAGGTSTVSKSVILHEGDTFTPLADQSYSDKEIGTTLNVIIPNVASLSMAVRTTSYGSDINRTICGPCTITVSNPGSVYVPPRSYAYCSYRITRAANNAIQPSNIISLPADANGNMQVIVETSTDLLNWDQCYSFTHNNSEGSGRFFRTRVIQSE